MQLIDLDVSGDDAAELSLTLVTLLPYHALCAMSCWAQFNLLHCTATAAAPALPHHHCHTATTSL